MKKRITISVYGQVQGVFFRVEAKEKAAGLGLTGWAANESDGSVKVVAEGEESALNQLVEWCKKGPGGAQVDKVEVNWQEATGEFDRFRIVY